jgi:hypothetical protein
MSKVRFSPPVATARFVVTPDVGAEFWRFFPCWDHRSAPRVAGLLVKIFVWVLELPVVGWVLLYILKKDNLINKVQLRHLNVLPLSSFLLARNGR